MRKIVGTALTCIIATVLVTACSPLEEYNGTVEVTEMEHIKFRPRMGKLPMRTAKWELTVCSTDTQSEVAGKCSVKRISKEQFDRISIGQTLEMSNGNLELD